MEMMMVRQEVVKKNNPAKAEVQPTGRPPSQDGKEKERVANGAMLALVFSCAEFPATDCGH
jgi:hypothetical protein